MKRKPYDEDELTNDIAEGKLAMTQIAHKHGLSPELLYDIARGRKRSRILARIVTVWRLIREDIRRSCAAGVKEMLDIHMETGRTDKGHNGRQCREFVMKHVLKDEDFRFEEGVDPAHSSTPAARWRRFCKRIQASAERDHDDQ